MITQRLPDPRPLQWLKDTSRVMGHHDGVFPVYGNFWARWPCRLRPHCWRVLDCTETDTPYPREIRRCRRCGSQVHQSVRVAPPARGRI